MVVIMIGRKRCMQPSKIASSGDLPSFRSASSAKSIIMMAFFLTIPISKTMPTNEYRLRSCLKISSVSNAPKPAAGRPERIVMG